MNKSEHLLVGIIYKKTDEWYIKWQQVIVSDTTSDSKWQRMTTSSKTNDSKQHKEWQRVVQQMTTSVKQRVFENIMSKRTFAEAATGGVL